jgi:predicted nucleic acid-binding protein
LNPEPVVVDASAIVHVLTSAGTHNSAIITALETRPVYSTEYIHIECINAFRRMLLSEEITAEIFSTLVSRLLELHITPVRLGLYAPRLVQHIRNVSVYDAAYVALAEHLDAPLITTDRKLQKLSTTNISFITAD